MNFSSQTITTKKLLFKLMEHPAAIILAAGKSIRMGKPKPFLKYKNSFFLKNIIETYKKQVNKITVVFNPYNFLLLFKHYPIYYPNLCFTINDNINERFYSIYKGILCLKNYNYIFIQNVDNPSVKLKTIQLLWKYRNKADVIIPAYKNLHGHPILINRNVIAAIKKQNYFHHNLKTFLQQFTKFYVLIKDRSILENINTLNEYLKLCENEKSV